MFDVAASKQESLTPVFNKLADDFDARLWGNVRYNATDDRIEQLQNWAACGCKLWDFEIGYHSRNRVD
ncbi:hypothetical protein, partial [Pseudomonas savastanoi]|uniref:hypothetical protein n=1 Tax=Pseudomonas savastanoi TaxID=29438 RepID=UPI001E598511